MKHFLIIIYLFFNIIQINAQVMLQQQQVIGGTGIDYAFDMAVDNEGYIYSVGMFSNTVDFNYGPGINELSSLGNTDGYILKTDSIGNFQWVIPIAGVNMEKCFGIGLDIAGNIYVGGHYGSTVDFDPGVGVVTMTTLTTRTFILKLDASGAFVWVRNSNTQMYGFDVSLDGIVVNSGSFSGTVDFDPGPALFNLGSDYGSAYGQVLDSDGNFLMAFGFNSGFDESSSACLIDDDNNVWITGTFGGTLDFDPGPGVFNLTSAFLSNTFVSKYGIDGTLLWAGTYDAANGEDAEITAITNDIAGNIYLGSNFFGTVDFDMGPGIANATADIGGSSDGYLLKITNDGIFVWVKAIPSTFLSTYFCVQTDDEQNVYAGGSFSYVTDLDPGLGIHNVYAHGEFGADDAFVQKLDADGNFVWAAVFGGDFYDEVRAVQLMPDNQILINGIVFGPLDMNPGAQVENVDGFGDYDIYFEKLKPTICADLTLIIDSVSIASCSGSGLATCHAISGIAPYEYVWETDPIIFDSVATFPEGGFYNVSVTDAMSCYKFTSVLVTGPATTTDIDMAGVIVNNGFAPGFNSLLWPEVYNNGCGYATGNYQVVLDPLLEYVSSTIPPDIISGDTLTWFFENINYDSIIPTPQVVVLTPAVIDIGWKLNLELIINAEGDIDETNNYVNYNIVVEGAIDPNDKQVTPMGTCDAGYVTHNQVLTYTVRFQNTGTAPAVNIVIDDTLSNRININSLRVVAASHPMHTEFEGLNIAKFVFNDIYLPDSTENEPESHGYVVFEVKTKPSAPDYSIVENSAAIYFDFNDPVITNSVINTLVDEVPEYNYTQDVTICESDSLIVGNHVYFNPGVYFDVLTGASGCDSALTTTLYVLEENAYSFDATICADETYLFNGELLSTTGIYFENLLNMAGCDSIITLNLHVNPIYETFIEASICSDESYLFNGELISATGTYNANLSSVIGCDSIVTLNLHVNPIYDTLIETSICPDETYLFNGELLSAAGTYNAAFLSKDGCDSIVTLNLSVTTVNTEVIAEETVLMAVQNDASYQWINCDNGNSTIEGATAGTYTPEVTGNYAVIVDYLGCVDTSSCFIAGPVNIQQLDNSLVLFIFPNPANQTLQITIPSVLTNGTITIYDTYGNLLMDEQQITQQTAILNLSELPAGFYVVQIQNGKYLARASFVKE